MPEAFNELVGRGRVHRRIYTDPGVFEQERVRIYRRVWLWLGHESQLKRPGDFFTTRMAGDRIIVARHVDGTIRAFHNRCAHRGAEVCAAPAGNTTNFVCPYHAWTYRTDGSLESVPLNKGYEADFHSRAAALRLEPVARLASYRGFIFGSHAASGDDLETFLGPQVCAAFDNFVDRAPDGEVEMAGGKTVQRYRGNWKLQIENSIDLLHPRILHHSAIDAADRVDHGGREPSIEWDIVKSNGLTLREWDGLQIAALARGHCWMGGFLTKAIDEDAAPADADATPADAAGWRALQARYREILAQRKGEARAAEILGFNRHNTIVYPNLFVNSRLAQIRVLHPVSVDCTEQHGYIFRLKGAPEEMFEASVRMVNTNNSPSSIVTSDDHEIFERIQQSLASGRQRMGGPVARAGKRAGPRRDERAADEEPAPGVGGVHEGVDAGRFTFSGRALAPGAGIPVPRGAPARRAAALRLARPLRPRRGILGPLCMGPESPKDHVSLFYESVALLRMRVDRLERELSPLDSPKARVNHYLSNITVEDAAGSAFLQHPAEEFPRALIARRAQDLRRRTLFHDHSAVHEHDLVRHFAREADLVRDDHHRHAVLCERAHHGQDLADQLGIERGGRLVEQHHARLHRERPGDGHALLLPAGELARIAVSLRGQADALEQRHCALARLRGRHFLHHDRSERHVLDHRDVLEEIEALEHHADIGAGRTQLWLTDFVEPVADAAIADQVSVHCHVAGVGCLEMVDATQEGRLSGARGPDDAHHLAGIDVEIDSFQDFDMAITLADVTGNDHGVRNRLRPTAAANSRRGFGPASLWLLPTCCSIRRCPAVNKAVSARYQSETTIRSGMVSNVRV